MLVLDPCVALQLGGREREPRADVGDAPGPSLVAVGVAVPAAEPVHDALDVEEALL